MSMSTFQKVTLVSCLVLCVALLLPKMLLSRGKGDAAQEGGAGHFPPMMHRNQAPEGQRGAGIHPKAHNTEAIARAKGSGTGAGTGGKSNLAGQIIPIYGFGILLYILYILFKITSKGKTAQPAESRFSAVRSENMKRKITDFELDQLQERLKETEEVMEKIVSKASDSPERVRGVSADQEERLLLQLREITRVMQEGRLVEGITPEREAEETPYAQDWEEYPEDTQQEREQPFCRHGHAQRPPSSERADRPGAGGEVEGGAEVPVGGHESEMRGAEDVCSGAGDEVGVVNDVGGAGDLEEGAADRDTCRAGDEEEDDGSEYEVEEQGHKQERFPVIERQENDDLAWTSVTPESGSNLLRRRNKKETA